METEDHKLNKSIAIVNAIKDTVDTITRHAKDIPKDKYHKNVFKKTYNRRPRNKQKTARAKIGMLMGAVTGAAQISIIASQPLPRFEKRSVARLNSIYEKEEIIMRRN